MHIWKSVTIDTEGCTAIAEENISDKHHYSNKNSVLVQLSQQSMIKLKMIGNYLIYYKGIN